VGLGSWPRKERFEEGDWGGREEEVPVGGGLFAEEEDAGGGPPERGDVGAKGSSKIVSVCARRVFIGAKEESTVNINIHTKGALGVTGVI